MSTTIIAIRHAKPKSEGYADETMRPLHEEGVAIQEKMTRLIEEKGYVPTRIFSSPILRAKQTAEIIADRFSLEVEEIDALGYALDAAYLSNLTKNEDNQTLVFVGHAPSLGEYVNQLVGKRVLPEGLCKSGTAVVKYDPKTQKNTFVEYLKP